MFRYVIGIQLAVAALLFAMPVDVEMAGKAAQTHLELHAEHLQNPDNRAIEAIGVPYLLGEMNILRDSKDDRVLAYVFNLDPVGYIVVSGDTRIKPVIVHSFKCDFRFDETPSNIMLKMLRGDLEYRYAALEKTSPEIISENLSEWSEYLSGGEGLFPLYSSMTIYGPWFDTNWGQSYPYNTRCPIDPETGSRCVTGCTATAMAMIHNYWEYPPFVAFAPDESYYSGYTSPPIFIDAPSATDDSIQYDNGTGHPSNSEIANLMWACGVSVGSWYSSSGTGANVSAKDYIDKWAYSENALTVNGSNADFYTYLAEDMIAGRPVQLAIYQSDWSGGHSINCDGYNSSTNRYHLNMGWDGYSNGWYSLPSGMPSGYSIIYYGVLRLEPDPRPDASNSCASAISISLSPEASTYKDAIYPAGDEDWFTFAAVPESSYIFYTRGSTNTYGAVYSSCGGEVLTSSTTGISRYNFYVQFTPPVAGTYKLLVRGDNSSEIGLYTLHYRTGQGPSINFLLPAPEAVLNEGANQVVQWISAGVPDFTLARLDYSLNGPDGPWNTITDSTTFTFHIWRVPYVHSDQTNVYVRVQSVEYNFISSEIGPLTILDGANIGEESDIPKEIEISAFPTPFNSTLRISAPENAWVTIYDIRGSFVCEIGKDRMWIPSEGAESGIYLISVKYDGKSRVIRAVYLK
jgi:hypothetical protein